MCMPNKDEIEGKRKQAVGAVKDKVGEWKRDPNLEIEGESERLEGEDQESFGKTRRKVGEKVKEVGEKIAR